MAIKIEKPRASRNSKNLRLRGTHLGEHVDQSAGTSDPKIARQERDRLIRQIEAGRFAKPTGLTWAEAVDRYLDNGGEKRFLKPITDYLGDTACSTIDQAAVDKLARKLKPDGKPATRNRQVYTPISTVLHGAGFDVRFKRPQSGQDKKRSKRTFWLQPQHAARVFEEADVIGPKFGLFLRVLVYTGLRLSEGLRLTWFNLNLDQGEGEVPVTKNGEARSIFLPDHLVAALRVLKAAEPEIEGRRIFWHKAGHLYTKMRKLKQALGPNYDKLCYHTMRHTWGTWMGRFAKVSTAQLISTGAWKSEKQAADYTHLDPQEEARRVALLPAPDALRLTAVRVA